MRSKTVGILSILFIWMICHWDNEIQDINIYIIFRIFAGK